MNFHGMKFTILCFLLCATCEARYVVRRIHRNVRRGIKASHLYVEYYYLSFPCVRVVFTGERPAWGKVYTPVRKL